MKSTIDCWGERPFENLSAQDLAFCVVTTSPDLNDLYSGLTSTRDDLQKVVALAELLNAMYGYLNAVEMVPALGQWVLDHSNGDPSLELRAAMADRLSAIAKASSLKKYWEGQGKARLNEWMKSVKASIDHLRSDRRGRKKKLATISKQRLMELMKRKWPKRYGNHCSEMFGGKSYRGYPQLEVSLAFVDAQTAAEMARSQSVISLRLNIKSSADDAAMLIPLKLLLRSWRRNLRRLEADVPDKETKSSLLKTCLSELASLPQLQVIETSCFLVDDPVVEALSANKQLREVIIQNGMEATNRSLDHLSKCKNLSVVRFWESKISDAKAAAFAKSHKKIHVHVV